jgi:putative spermidine/putrescine transport system substrate-binding protein
MSYSLGKLTSIALCLAGMAMASTAHAQKPDRITVAWYGGNWGTAFNTCVAQPFTKATGITVSPEIGNSTTTLAKLQQQKDAPTIDVAYMDGGVSEVAQAAGVLETLEPTRLKNMAGMLPEGIYKQGAGAFAISSGYYSLGLTYNTKEVKKAPTSWKELWNPAYAGAIAVPSVASSGGIPFAFFLNQVWSPDAKQIAPALGKLRELDTAVMYDSSGAASNAFQSGEATIGAHFSVGAWDLIDKGLPIGFVVPKEGAWATDARLHLVKNSKNRAAAEAFIDYAMTPAAASCLAEKLYLGPAVKDVKVPSSVARKLPWGETGSVADLRLFDWGVINARRAEVTDAWNREIARKR